jgi:ferric-dicitrate binding protein FerR (iron transport regulator)
MPDNKDIDQILAAFLSDKATDFEQQQLSKWAEENALNAYQLDQLRKIWKERLPDQKLIDSDNLKSGIWAAVHEQSRPFAKARRISFGNALWRAAAVLLLLAVPLYLVLRSNSLQKSAAEAQQAVRMVEKSNPIGQKSKIQLPDGSIVWLNAESSLSYAEDFSDSVRWVSLTGEAFFSVLKDTLHPFVVHTGNMDIRVLGTQFNVCAFEDLSHEEVALLEGKVEISFPDAGISGRENVLLEPGEGLSYGKSGNTLENFVMDNLNPEQNKYAAWKEGRLIFDGEDFEEFLGMIRRWYGVRVAVQGVPPADWRIRASFEDEYLTNILEAISFNKEFAYKIDKKNLTILFNQQMKP